MEYALRLAKIESVKAKERSLANLKQNDTEMEIFPPRAKKTVRDIVAAKIGIGSGKQFDKEKYIYENQ